MDVFVIPAGGDRYELYCEQPIVGDEPASPQRGIVGKVRNWFSAMIRAAEERHRQGPAAAVPSGWTARLQDRAMGWVAERIAEQRLLWNLRGLDSVTAAYPTDMTFDQVQNVIRLGLRKDYERRRKWMVIDGLLFLITFVALGPLFILIPGVANLPALYFGFRAVGHFLSMRGAGHGLKHVVWTGRPCPPLVELRGLERLDPLTRANSVHDIGVRLHLEHLPTFFDRVNRYNSPQ